MHEHFSYQGYTSSVLSQIPRPLQVEQHQLQQFHFDLILPVPHHTVVQLPPLHLLKGYSTYFSQAVNSTRPSYIQCLIAVRT